MRKLTLEQLMEAIGCPKYPERCMRCMDFSYRESKEDKRLERKRGAKE